MTGILAALPDVQGKPRSVEHKGLLSRHHRLYGNILRVADCTSVWHCTLHGALGAYACEVALWRDAADLGISIGPRILYMMEGPLSLTVLGLTAMQWAA